MNESIPLGPLNIALIEDAAKDLEDFSEQIMAPGHWAFLELSPSPRRPGPLRRLLEANHGAATRR